LASLVLTLPVGTNLGMLHLLWMLVSGQRTRFNQAVSLAEQRRLFQDRWGAVCALLRVA